MTKLLNTPVSLREMTLNERAEEAKGYRGFKGID